MTARPKQAHATAVCEGLRQRTQFANPSVAYSMCLKGAQSRQKNAPATIRTSSAVKPLSSRAQSRAEYTEIGNAFRGGCNLN